MPRFNVYNSETDEWRCFSTIVDDWVTDWMDEIRYERWRRHEYGAANWCPVQEANQMSLEEAEERIESRKEAEHEDN